MDVMGASHRSSDSFGSSARKRANSKMGQSVGKGLMRKMTLKSTDMSNTLDVSFQETQKKKKRKVKKMTTTAYDGLGSGTNPMASLHSNKSGGKSVLGNKGSILVERQPSEVPYAVEIKKDVDRPFE